MKITKDTCVSAILEEYGDIADVMEVFGVKRVARYSLRWLAAKAVTVEWAARLHRFPLSEAISPPGNSQLALTRFELHYSACEAWMKPLASR